MSGAGVSAAKAQPPQSALVSGLARSDALSLSLCLSLSLSLCVCVCVRARVCACVPARTAACRASCAGRSGRQLLTTRAYPMRLGTNVNTFSPGPVYVNEAPMNVPRGCVACEDLAQGWRGFASAARVADPRSVSPRALLALLSAQWLPAPPAARRRTPPSWLLTTGCREQAAPPQLRSPIAGVYVPAPVSELAASRQHPIDSSTLQVRVLAHDPRRIAPDSQR